MQGGGVLLVLSEWNPLWTRQHLAVFAGAEMFPLQQRLVVAARELFCAETRPSAAKLGQRLAAVQSVFSWAAASPQAAASAAASPAASPAGRSAGLLLSALLLY